MELQSLSKHFSDDSLLQQTGLLSAFSDNNCGLCSLCLCCFCFASSCSLPRSDSSGTSGSSVLATQPYHNNLLPLSDSLLISDFSFFPPLCCYFICFAQCKLTTLLLLSLSFTLTFLAFRLTPSPSSKLASLFCQRTLFTDSYRGATALYSHGEDGVFT